MQAMKLIILFFASTATARLLRKPKTQKPNFARLLVGISSNIKANLTAQLTSLQPPEFSTDIFGCALSIKNGMDDLRLSYTEVHVPTVIEQACEFSNVYLELGKSKEKCGSLLTALKEEWSGEQNYHRWCRKVAAAESEAMAKALKKIDSDPEAKKLLGSCEKACPKIAAIIKLGASTAEVFMEAMQPPAPGTTFKDLLKKMTEFFKKVATNIGAVCDEHKAAKCTLDSMHGACTTMFDKIGLPLPIIDDITTRCSEFEPCKSACNGVFEKSQDFEVKSMMMQLFGQPISEELTDLCKSYQRVDECYKKPECTHVLSRFEHSIEPMEKTCEVVEQPCFSKIATKCKDDAEKWFGKADDEATFDQQTCTDKFYPWVQLKPEDEKKCCKEFGSLAKCAKDLKCEKTLEQVMYITPDPRWPEGEVVECTCQSEWKDNIGGEVCPGGNVKDHFPPAFH